MLSFLEMLFKVWWGDLRKAVTNDSTQGTLVCTAQYQGAGTSLSIFALVSRNFTGFHTHTEWMSLLCPGWDGVRLFELPPSCTADEKPDTNTDICQCPCHCLSACVRCVWFLARSQRFLPFGPWVYWLCRNKQGVLPKDYAAGDAMLTAFSRPSEENLQTSSPVTGLPLIAVCLQPFVV